MHVDVDGTAKIASDIRPRGLWNAGTSLTRGQSNGQGDERDGRMKFHHDLL
jgi:hypothetical protein